MATPQEIFRNVHRIDLKTRRLVEGLMQGAYYSVFKGRGIEFSEVRKYQHGDDIRSIDWNVTARMGEPFVKEFVEERDLTVYIIFDVSGSGDFGSFDKKKIETGAEIAASIALSASMNNDSIGLLLCTDRVEMFLPPKKGKKQVLRIIREILYHQTISKRTDLARGFRFLSRIKRKGIVFIISDFIDDMEKLQMPLRQLRNRHDVIALRIFDPRERDIPDVGYVYLEDQETGEQILVDTSDEEFRSAYKNMAEKLEDGFSKSMKKNRIDRANIDVSQKWQKPVLEIFRNRGRRLR